MKSRITTKFLVVAALLVLLINVFSSFGSLFVQAQTTSTGYKVDVTYQEGSAKLTGNTTDVLSGYQLTSLTDDSTGQQYDPSTFSMEVSKNGTYTFTLGYTLNGISTQTQSEKITVVVDKISQTDTQNQDSTSVMTENSQEQAKNRQDILASRKTVSVSQLEGRATEVDSMDGISAYAYAYETYQDNGTGVGQAQKIKTDSIAIPQGYFETNKATIDEQVANVDGGRRHMALITLAPKADSTSENVGELKISGLWYLTETDGSKKLYYTVSEQSSDIAKPGLAYETKKDDEVRVYYNLSATPTYTLDYSSIANKTENGSNLKYKINVSPGSTDGTNKVKVSVGTVVTVEITWPLNVDRVNNVKYSYNGNSQNITLLRGYPDVYNLKIIGTFVMPSYDTTLKIDNADRVLKNSQHWVGVYNSGEHTYQRYEYGFSGIGFDADPNSNVGTIDQSKAISYYQRCQGNLYSNYKSVEYANTAYINRGYINSDADGYGNAVKGYLNPTDSENIYYPVQEYQSGTTQTLVVESNRGKGMTNYSSEYNILCGGGTVNGKGYNWGNSDAYQRTPDQTASISIYPQNQSQQGDAYARGFKKYSFKLFQSKDEYDQARQGDSSYPTAITSGDTSGQGVGLYPTKTTLTNGIVIECYPLWWNSKAGYDGTETKSKYPKLESQFGSGDSKGTNSYDTGYGYYKTSDPKGADYQSLYGLYWSFRIKIYNAYDDIRVDVNTTTSTTNAWNTLGSTTNINKVYGNTDKIDAAYLLETGKTKTTDQVQYKGTLNGQSSKFMNYIVEPKEGYSVPYPTKSIVSPVNSLGSSNYGMIKGVDSTSDPGKNNTSVITKVFTSLSNLNNITFGGTDVTNSVKNKNFYDATTHTFNYYSWCKSQGASVTTVDFISEPVEFDYEFSLSSGGSWPSGDPGGLSGTSYTIDGKRYFTVPSVVPNNLSGQLFSGWSLEVQYTPIDSTQVKNILLKNVTADSNGYPNTDSTSNYVHKDANGYYYPGDLLDIKFINRQIQAKASADNIGIKDYKLVFKSQFSNAEAVVTTLTTTIKTQNGYKDSYTSSSGQQSVMKNVKAYITTPVEKNENGNTYFLDDTSKNNLKFTTSTDNPSVTLTYDKAPTIVYKDGTGKIISNTRDTESYHTYVSGHNNTIVMMNESELKAAMQQAGATWPSDKEFGGWEVTANDSGQTSLKKYTTNKPTENITVDLSDLGDKGVTAYNSSGLIIRPIWNDAVAAIQNEDSSYGIKQVSMESQGKWAYQGKPFDISATFAYVGGNNNSYQNAKNNKQIYYALYKLNPSTNGTSIGSGNYELWYSSKKGDATSGKVSEPVLSDSLSGNKFTISFTVDNGTDYTWNNNARYAIVAWTSANGDDECFNSDGTIDTGASFSDASTFSKIPAVSNTARVLQPLQITATGSSVSGNRIDARKLLYNDQTFDISFDVNTGNSKLTQEEAAAEFNIAVGKQDPKSDNIQLWYAKKPFSTYKGGAFTDQGGGSSGVKMNTPTITLKSPTDGKSNQFTIKVTGIKDTMRVQPEWQSEARYSVYAWNDANTTPPTTVQKDPTNKPKNYSIANDSATDVPRKHYTTYIINDDGLGNSYPSVNGKPETEGKAFYGTVSYPANINVQENTSTKKLESSVMKVQLNAVWIDSNKKDIHVNNSSVTPVAKTQPVEHDFSYGVTLTGGNVSSDTSGTKVRLTQATTSQSVDAKILTSTGGVVKNGSLGTLDFYANKASGVQELGFKLQTDSIPSSLTKDVFSGTIGYSFIRNDLTGGGST